VTPRLVLAAFPLLLGTALTAQEPRLIRPDTVEFQGVPRPIPPGGFMSEGRVQILTSRRARVGITINMRARATDSIGALIQAVTPNSPAAKAGLRSGDVITRFNGSLLVDQTVRTAYEQSRSGVALAMLAAALTPGDTVAIEYRRGKDRRNASVVVGDEPAWVFSQPEGSWVIPFSDNEPEMGDGFATRPDGPRGRMTFRIESDSSGLRGEQVRRMPPMMFTVGTPLEDLELAPVNRDLGRYFGVVGGVLVISVPAESRLGLKAGDVVLSVDGRVPEGPGHLLRILRSYEGGEQVHFAIKRMKRNETITGTIASAGRD
jgi:S1-C subfamily serine protease